MMQRPPSVAKRSARLSSKARTSPPRPRTKPAEVRREELMVAAERLFLEKGIAGASVEQIVAAADVAKGTFYLHFASKEQLLIALQQRYVAAFAETIRVAVDRRPRDDWSGRLRAWVEAGIRAYLDRQAVHDLVFHEFRPEGRGPTHENLAIAHLTGLLAEGTRAGAWALEDPALTATMLFHALHGLLDEGATRGARVDRARLARVANAHFRRVVGSA